MLNIILEELKKQNTEHYLINEKRSTVNELYFIKRNLDMRRINNVTKYELTVYKDFEKDGMKMRGSSTCNLYPGMASEEIAKKITDTLHAASFACNPFFEFPKPCVASQEKTDFPAEKTLSDAVSAIYEADNDSEGFINSAELFAENNIFHTVSSWGTDVTYSSHSIHGEYVTQCCSPEDVETYQDFHYIDLDKDALVSKVKRAIELTKSRAIANKCMVSGKIKLILSGQYVSDLLHFYSERAAASMIYPHYSDFELNKQVQSDSISGDKLNISLTSDTPFSKEGIPMKERSLITDGVLNTIHGSSRFSYYLNIEPTGVYEGIKVVPGTTSLNEMESGRYLHVVNFSDFQMDAMSGRFGGEFRLAFYCDGDKVIPITNGSVSGSILELAGNIRLSSETQKLKNYEGPFAIEINEANIG